MAVTNNGNTGNSNSGRKSGFDEKKILKLKGLAVDFSTEILEKPVPVEPKGKDKKDWKEACKALHGDKMAIVLKLLGNIIPKETILTTNIEELENIEKLTAGILTGKKKASGKTVPQPGYPKPSEDKV